MMFGGKGRKIMENKWAMHFIHSDLLFHIKNTYLIFQIPDHLKSVDVWKKSFSTFAKFEMSQENHPICDSDKKIWYFSISCSKNGMYLKFIFFISSLKKSSKQLEKLPDLNSYSFPHIYQRFYVVFRSYYNFLQSSYSQ